MEHKTAQSWNRARRELSRGARTASGRARTGSARLGRREKQRLLQLGVCIALFLVVFIGKGVFPEQISLLRERLVAVMGMDTDFQAVFSNLGHAISEGEPVLDTLGGLWVDVFGDGQAEVPYEKTVSNTPAYEAERAFAAQPLTAETILSHRFGIEGAPEEETPAEVLPPQPTPVPTPEPTPEPEEPAVEHVDYDGPALPENATMDKYALGIEVMSPIEGVEGAWVSSTYGWREHPVDGEDRFHCGVDLAVNSGSPVYAFADGVVDYIGESDIYGLYLQIQHDNGVTSFYAHCSALLVQEGQEVKRGDLVAQSGATGNVTGPHLHFELRKDGVLLNPLYYIPEP